MKTETLNPIEQISMLLEKNGYGKGLILGHISYEEEVNNTYDYQIIRSLGHDGTLLFTMQTINEALFPLMNKTTYCSNNISVEELNNLKDINYTIGDIRLETAFGEINSKAGKIPGQTDTVYIPVRCEYIFN